MGISNVDAQGVYSDTGLRTQYGLVLPPGSRVAAYVRSTGLQSGDDSFLAQNLVSTLAQGLARVRAGLGDAVVCLPGHVENVVDATTFSGALVAGTKIFGVGRGGNTPTFTFTTAGSSWAIGVPDVMIAGLRIQPISTTSVTTAISVTANDCGLYYNEVICGNTTAVFFNAITVSGTAARYDITGNIFRPGNPGSGTTSSVITINSTGDSGRICDNEILAPSFTNSGVINVTAAATNLKILRNVVSNITAASVAGISFSNVAVTGQCAYNSVSVFNGGAQTSGTTGITIGAAVTMQFFQNFVCNDPLKSGILQPAADT